MGDPYQGIDAGQDGTIIVKNYGGSRERWSVHYTVAFHDGAFQIVAVKRSTFDSLKPKSIKENTIDLRPGVGTNTASGSASHNLTPVRIEACQDVEKL